MPGVEVAAVVSSIIAAFGSGLDIFKRMRTKQKARRQSRQEANLTDEEAKLHDSLYRAPREIRAEYDRNVIKLGHRFEIGDAVAHTSLAHTLLVLNTGLINIINHALSEDPRARQLSKKSLLSLTEIAAADTINALGQLNERLSSSPNLAGNSTQQPTTHHRKKRTTSRYQGVVTSTHKTIPTQKKKKRPEVDPLARGGWVRSKSGTSVISSGSSTPRPAKHERVNSSQSVPQAPILTKLELQPLESTTLPPNLPCACQVNISSHQHDNESHSHYQQLQEPQPHREPDLLLASADVFNTAIPPPRPPKVPIQRTTSGRKPRPPSVATFLTASTKIGEIPEHRWLDRPVLPWDNRPLPYVIPPPLEPVVVEKKSRGFKSWWKNCNLADRNVLAKQPT